MFSFLYFHIILLCCSWVQVLRINCPDPQLLILLQVILRSWVRSTLCDEVSKKRIGIPDISRLDERCLTFPGASPVCARWIDGALQALSIFSGKPGSLWRFAISHIPRKNSTGNPPMEKLFFSHPRLGKTSALAAHEPKYWAQILSPQK